MKFYAIHLPANQRGIYLSWPECLHRVRGVSHARYMKFNNRPSARYFSKHGKQRPIQRNNILSHMFGHMKDHSIWHK